MRVRLVVSGNGEVIEGPELFEEDDMYEVCSVLSADREKIRHEIILEFSGRGHGRMRDVTGEYDSGTIFADNWK
jgi:hypothetical protein